MFKQGNELAHLTTSVEEMYAFIERAEKQNIDPEQLWMNIITDNGKIPIQRFMCKQSQDNTGICDSHCKDEDCPWLRERGIETSERNINEIKSEA
jgi:hypothetical protein